MYKKIAFLVQRNEEISSQKNYKIAARAGNS